MLSCTLPRVQLTTYRRARRWLCGELVFVDQPAEQVTAADAIEVDRLLVAPRRLAQRWPLVERAVRAVLVVMGDIRGEDVLEVAAANDQDPVEALSAHSPNPAFGMRAPSVPAPAP